MTEIILDLDEKEMACLNAAVCDFYHKMRSSEEDPVINWVEDSHYSASRNLWNKVREITGIDDEPDLPEAIAEVET